MVWTIRKLNFETFGFRMYSVFEPWLYNCFFCGNWAERAEIRNFHISPSLFRLTKHSPSLRKASHILFIQVACEMTSCRCVLPDQFLQKKQLFTTTLGYSSISRHRKPRAWFFYRVSEQLCSHPFLRKTCFEMVEEIKETKMCRAINYCSQKVCDVYSMFRK